MALRVVFPRPIVPGAAACAAAGGNTLRFAIRPERIHLLDPRKRPAAKKLNDEIPASSLIAIDQMDERTENRFSP